MAFLDVSPHVKDRYGKYSQGFYQKPVNIYQSMNPPESQGVEYDRGYSDGYRDRGFEQVVIDMREMRNVRPEDLLYLSEICERMSPECKKVLDIPQ